MEAFQRMSDDLLKICPSCEQPALKRKIGRGAGIIFKGGGFYETDFKERKGSRDSSDSSGDAAGKPDKAEKSPASEATKPESKAAAKTGD